jgi:hypothetical protein
VEPQIEEEDGEDGEDEEEDEIYSDQEMQEAADNETLWDLRMQFSALNRWWYRPCDYCGRQPH